MEQRDKGPIEILCKEIGLHFEKDLERTDVLVAFVASLVGEISHMRAVQDQIAEVTGKPPSDNSAEALRLAGEMLSQDDDDTLIKKAAAVHDFSHTAAPDDMYPADHLIDMVSSCASAIRFGLKKPCRSRHAAEAANHIWKHKYGVSLFDHFTSGWENEWARAKFHEAILSMTPIRGCAPTPLATELPRRRRNGIQGRRTRAGRQHRSHR